MKSRETRFRSLIKTVTWRVLATLGTWLVVYLFTGQFWESLGASITAAIFSMIPYYIHERAWNRISWGLKHH